MYRQPAALAVLMLPLLMLTLLMLTMSTSAGAQTWTFDPEASLFAVVTHKEGLAAGLAHEHLVVARDYDTSLSQADGAPESFTMEFATNDLLVDDPDLASAWQERLLDLDLIAEPFAKLSEKDRGKIRKSMLGRKQLDAENHPKIRAELTEIRPEDAGGDRGGYVGTLSLTVKGKTASREIEFEWNADTESATETGDPRRIEVTTAFDFTEFGIEPYSAMLGSIRVADTFHVFVVVAIDRA